MRLNAVVAGTKAKTWPRAIRRQTSFTQLSSKARAKNWEIAFYSPLRTPYALLRGSRVPCNVQPVVVAYHFPAKWFPLGRPWCYVFSLPAGRSRLSFVALLLASCCSFFDASTALSGGLHSATVRLGGINTVIDIRW